MGGSPSIPQRDLGGELKDLFGTGYPLAQKAYNKFWQNEPLLTGAHDFAQGNLENVGSLIDPLMSMYQKVPGQMEGYIKNIGDLAPGLQRTMRNLPNVQGLAHPLELLQRSLSGVYGSQIAPVLNRGGALTGEQERDVEQATRADFAARGNVMGNQALGSELLNRDQYRRTRFNEALGQGLGISGEERGLASGIEGLYGQDAATRLGLTQGLSGLYGQQAGLRGQEVGLTTGLAQGVQGLQQGALNQALGAEQGQVGSFATLMNPLYSYGSDLSSSNQNAAAAQSIAGGNKSSGLIGGGASALGAIAGGVGIAL